MAEKKGQNKMMTNDIVEKINSKPEKKGKTFSFPDGVVVEASTLGEAQEKHAIIIKKQLKTNK